MSNVSVSGVLQEEFIAQVRNLLGAMEKGNSNEAERLLDEITKLREDSLFRELGKLTREFHESLNGFRLDSRIASLAKNDIPDARDRLSYVITMTEQAANQTLGAVENSLPTCEMLERNVAALGGRWERFMKREMDLAEFRLLSQELKDFFALASAELPKLHANFQEVLVAQGFQDLTGQIIHRVITLVEELERNLVELVRISGQNLLLDRETKSDISASGPAIPGLDKGTVLGQDEVDNLLSSLGF